MEIKTYHLPPDQYVTTETEKEYIFIHHTAGWNNPYDTIDGWKNDDRGRIATKYVIGGPNPKTGDATYDGVIVEAFPGNNYAYHLGNVNSYMHSHSVGIELCNFGQLTKQGSEYITYAGTTVTPDQVCDLGFSFRGFQYFHKYSTKQIEALSDLLKMLAKQHKINIKAGMQPLIKDGKAFDYSIDAVNGKVRGLLTHVNVRKDKVDCSPQPALIELIKSL